MLISEIEVMMELSAKESEVIMGGLQNQNSDVNISKPGQSYTPTDKTPSALTYLNNSNSDCHWFITFAGTLIWTCTLPEGATG